MIDKVFLHLTYTEGAITQLLFLRNNSWPRTDDIQIIAKYIFECELNDKYVRNPLDPTERYPLYCVKKMKIIECE